MLIAADLIAWQQELYTAAGTDITFDVLTCQYFCQSLCNKWQAYLNIHLQCDVTARITFWSAAVYDLGKNWKCASEVVICK